MQGSLIQGPQGPQPRRAPLCRLRKALKLPGKVAEAGTSVKLGVGQSPALGPWDFWGDHKGTQTSGATELF